MQQREWLILPIDTITFHNMTLANYYRKHKQLCTVAYVVLSPCVTVNSCLGVPTDFSLIREGGETMWKSHELQGWGINKRRESCTECVCSGSTAWKGPTGGHQGSCLLIFYHMQWTAPLHLLPSQIRMWQSAMYWCHFSLSQLLG